MKTEPNEQAKGIQIANDGEVGLTYRMDGKSYAVALTREQHTLLQGLVPVLGKLHVAKSCEVDFVSTLSESSTKEQKEQ